MNIKMKCLCDKGTYLAVPLICMAVVVQRSLIPVIKIPLQIAVIVSHSSKGTNYE